jgi:dihydroorotase
MNDDEAMDKVIRSALPTGKRISVHAEDDSMISGGEERNNRDHLRNRPVSAEHNAIRRLAKYKNTGINICHITDPVSAERASSLGFTTEVTMHHLFFSDSVSDSAEFKVNPPLRDTGTRDELFKAFREGKITMFGTDHAPHTADEKRAYYDDAPSGIPGVETYIPIMMNHVKKGNIDIGRIARMASAAPADAFGLNKGYIEKGRDADLMIFDMKRSTEIRSKKLHGKAGYTPYEGWDAIFPDMVMLRGVVQVKGGELCGEMIGRDISE